MSIYLVRIGEGSKYTEEGYKNNFIAIGWNEIPDLLELGNLKKIKNLLEQSSYNYTPAQIAAQAGQLYRFGIEMKEGDLVLSPRGGGEYLVGEVGEYYFEQNPSGTCDYKHRRKVKWIKTILKEDMSTNLAYSLGAILTIFSLNRYEQELKALITGEVFTPAEKPQRIRDLIIDGLYELDGKEFEEFVRHVLEIIGFTAETTQYVGDNGIDVNGILDAEGLANIVLRIQVKRVRSSISNTAILALRGALRQEEHGCFITLSSFTSSAIEEAQAAGKVPIRLIDGEDLAAIILKHYDDIDDGYKARFRIVRKKDFNIEDQFEAVSDHIVQEEVKQIVETKIETPKWDTIVCAAKEDGFKKAFIDEKAWWAVRLYPKTIPFIKYISMYQVAPVSKITYYGKVLKIEPYENTGKYKIILDGDPIKLKNPVGLGENPHLKPQGAKYAVLEKILKAKTLDEVFK